MDQLDHFRLLAQSIKLAGKDVIEIGGGVPPNLVAPSGVKSWTAVDIIAERFMESYGSIKPPPWYHPKIASVTDLPFKDNSFDIAFAVNCFEHVHGLKNAMSELYRVMRPGSILFTKFNPIWSSAQGHHTWISDNDRLLVFSDGILPDWSHLVWNENELRGYATKKYSADIAQKFVDLAFNAPNHINRLIDTDYEKILSDSLFLKVLNVKLKSKNSPDSEMMKRLKTTSLEVTDFRTKGYVWILAKKPCHPLQKFSILFNFYKAAGLMTLRKKLK